MDTPLDTAAVYAELSPEPQDSAPDPQDAGVDVLQFRDAVVALSETYRQTQDISAISERIDRCVRQAYTSEYCQTLIELRAEAAQLLLDMLQAWLDHVQETHPRRRSGRHLIIKIALASNAMPRQLYLAGVVFHPMPSVFGGAFSDIYFGTYQAMEVAVKRPRHASSKDRERTAKYFRRQTLVWRGLNHPNVLQFLGLYSNPLVLNDLSLVSPRMAYNLSDYMDPAYERFDGARDRARVLREMAEGLCYLHSNYVVHGDIKPDNILISADGVAHVADFDMIVLADSSLGRQATDSGNRGTAAFKAPERFMGLKRPNEAGDVYAFACLCVVVSTGGKALFDNDEPGAIANYVGHEDKRPQRPSAAHCRGPPITDDFWHLIETCWRTKPQERLTMREVLAYFHRNVLYESPLVCEADDVSESRACASEAGMHVDPMARARRNAGR